MFSSAYSVFLSPFYIHPTAVVQCHGRRRVCVVINDKITEIDKACNVRLKCQLGFFFSKFTCQCERIPSASSQDVSITRVFPSRRRHTKDVAVGPVVGGCRNIQQCSRGFRFDFESCKCTRVTAGRARRDPKAVEDDQIREYLRRLAKKSRNSRCKTKLQCSRDEVWNAKLCKCSPRSNSLNHESMQKQEVHQEEVVRRIKQRKSASAVKQKKAEARLKTQMKRVIRTEGAPGGTKTMKIIKKEKPVEMKTQTKIITKNVVRKTASRDEKKSCPTKDVKKNSKKTVQKKKLSSNKQQQKFESVKFIKRESSKSSKTSNKHSSALKAEKPLIAELKVIPKSLNYASKSDSKKTIKIVKSVKVPKKTKKVVKRDTAQAKPAVKTARVAKFIKTESVKSVRYVQPKKKAKSSVKNVATKSSKPEKIAMKKDSVKIAQPATTKKSKKSPQTPKLKNVAIKESLQSTPVKNPLTKNAISKPSSTLIKSEKKSAAPAKPSTSPNSNCIPKLCPSDQKFCTKTCQCIAAVSQSLHQGGIPQPPRFPTIPEPNPYNPRPIFTLPAPPAVQLPCTITNTCLKIECPNSAHKLYSTVLGRCY